MRTISPTLPQSTTTAIYEENQKQVRMIAHGFARKYNLDRDETVARTHLYFLEAIHTFDPERSGSPHALQNRIQFYVWGKLIDGLKRDIKTQNRTVNVGKSILRFSTHDPVPFDKEGVVRSEDAKTVLGLVLNTPEDLAEEIRKRGGENRKVVRRCLKSYLFQKFRWTTKQVAMVFREISEALA